MAGVTFPVCRFAPALQECGAPTPGAEPLGGERGGQAGRQAGCPDRQLLPVPVLPQQVQHLLPAQITHDTAQE